MSNLKSLTNGEIKEQFETLFRQLVTSELPCRQWQQADIVFRNGKASDNFADVEFLMANHQNGTSLLYTSQSQGSSVYSVVGRERRVSFTCRR